MNNKEVYDFYENGAEIGRLERGLGVIEAARTKDLLARYIQARHDRLRRGGRCRLLLQLACVSGMYRFPL